MKGNRNPPPAPAPADAPPSPASKNTAKYINKDGSKFITVPKASQSTDSSQPSPTSASATLPPPAPGVNRKKQKRRAKAALKAAAEQQAQAGQAVNGTSSALGSHDRRLADTQQDDEDEDDEQDAGRGSYGQQQQSLQNGSAQESSNKSKKSKKKKKKGNASTGTDPPAAKHSDVFWGDVSRRSHPHQSQSTSWGKGIWDTSTAQERERIKAFWMDLTENDRKDLVKVEKDAVLRKMKEQQRHTCSCTVCGRKRTAIEEELEGLYDAYYQELEQYANHPKGEGPPMLQPRHPFGAIGAVRRRGLPSRYSNAQPYQGRIVEHVTDDEDEEEEDGLDGADHEHVEGQEGSVDGSLEYSDEDDDDYSEEDVEPSERSHRGDYESQFQLFGNSLTVQGRDRLPILPSFLQSSPSTGTGNNAYGSSSLGGILTVADDLLKNDGRKFIEMMENLAERRMAREIDVREHSERGYGHANGDRYAHDHASPPDEDDYEDDEDEYDDEEDGEYDSQEEEEDALSVEQRMEEGRRMFQIFAARMFEQRVLHAYREKVAQERQAQLLEEIEIETQQDAQRKAKKAKESQRRKDRQARKKEAQAEEKARRESERAAEEAARRAEEDRKAEEQRLKGEEKRKKREAQKKAEEEERQRKEVERLRKIHEREENERKAREAKEREKKAREDARLKEQEAREQKEREAKQRREAQEKAKREKDAKAKLERENREPKETKEKRKKEERAAQKAAALAAAPVPPVPVTLPKRPAQQPPAAVPALPQPSTSYISPKITVATPVLSKVPTPMRARQPSQQESTAAASSGPTSLSGSGPSQNPSPNPLTPVHSSPGPIGPASKSGLPGAIPYGVPQPAGHAASPVSIPAKTLPLQPNLFGMPPAVGGAMPFYPPGLPQMPAGFGNGMHRDHVFAPSTGYRPPGVMPMPPPGLGAPVAGRGFSIHPPPGFHGPLDSPLLGMAQMAGPGFQEENSGSHSRQGSGSFESGVSQPIARPTPIGRPASVVHGQRPTNGSPSRNISNSEVDAHLGSSALLDDLDDPLIPEYSARTSRPPMMPLPRAAPGFPMVAPFGAHPFFPSHHNPWAPAAHQPGAYAPAPPPGLISAPWGPVNPQASSFGSHSIVERPTENRAVAFRKMLRRACEELAVSGSNEGDSGDRFVKLENIKARVAIYNQGHPVDEKDLLDYADTEGNENNGGGSFDVREDEQGNKSIRYVPGSHWPAHQPALQQAVGSNHPSSPIGAGSSTGGSR
ncbi:salt tolerance down-regulator-domain-containing protein [Cladorrhinum sp. PSN259]|nr:salt tolerance down-regulator-domain-containing protein [Cladorrhinum sp. PSN259]